MISINAPDFVENFNVAEMTVGIIGHGYVGQAVEAFFSSVCRSYVYDKYDSKLDTLETVIKNSHVIFVCVPTPMNRDGSCHTGIVESVLDDIVATAERVERDVNEFVVVVKSTVWPGFTDKMREQKKLRIVFSPEFLTEKNSIQDFENTNRLLLGGQDEDALVIFKFFEKKLASRATIVQCDSSVAEMTKLFANAMLTVKVMFANEMYFVCKELGINYEEVKTLACLDRRIAHSHLSVPGHDGDFGYGGHCFPKDIGSLRSIAKRLNIGEKLFTACIERNDEVRNHKDWEDMKGRAVVEDYEKDNK